MKSYFIRMFENLRLPSVVADEMFEHSLFDNGGNWMCAFLILSESVDLERKDDVVWCELLVVVLYGFFGLSLATSGFGSPQRLSTFKAQSNTILYASLYCLYLC